MQSPGLAPAAPPRGASARTRPDELRAATPTRDELPTLTVGELLAPLPAREWVVPRLAIAGSGRASLVYGPPGGGKSITTMTLALAVASGQPWAGVHATRCADVLWIDAEVGPWMTRSRLQRIARAAGIDATDLEDRLRVAIHPSLTLDSPTAERVLTATCRRYGLVVIDSLSALSGAAEEHTPEMGRIMLMLGRVSAATGAAILVLHHTRRDGELRGSTSIPAGAECIWHVVDVDGAAGTLRHVRSPMGEMQPDIRYRIVDVPIDGDPRGGLALALDTEDGRGANRQASIDEAIVAHLAAVGGSSGRALTEAMERRDDVVRAAVERLIRAGRVARTGAGAASRIVLTGGVR